jgi:hypothetical protein
MIDLLDEYDLGHLLEWEGVQYASPTFLITEPEKVGIKLE